MSPRGLKARTPERLGDVTTVLVPPSRDRPPKAFTEHQAGATHLWDLTGRTVFHVTSLAGYESPNISQVRKLRLSSRS